jgi:putative membrane protein
VRHWLIHWILSAVSLLIVANVLPGIQVDSFLAAFLAAAFIGLANATAGLVLKVILFPLIILSLGIVSFFINGLMLMLAAEVVPGFRVRGWLTAAIGSLLLTIVNYTLLWVFGW